MKKLVFSAALVLSLGLTACGEEKTTGESKEETQTPASTETEKVQKEESKSDDNEVKEGTLTKAGQWTMDGQDKVTLVKIKEVNQTFKQGPINLTIESVKLLHHSNISNETKEYLKNVSGKDVTELNTIQLIYKMENTVDDNVMMTAIDTLTTNTKAQIHGYDNMSLTDDTGNYAGKVIVDGMAIFPYFNSTLDEINTIFINTGMTFNSDSGTNLGDSQRIEIAF